MKILDTVNRGVKVKVKAINASPGLERRLFRMESIKGNVIEVLSNDGWGPIVVSVDNAQIAIIRSISEYHILLSLSSALENLVALKSLRNCSGF